MLGDYPFFGVDVVNSPWLEPGKYFFIHHKQEENKMDIITAARELDAKMKEEAAKKSQEIDWTAVIVGDRVVFVAPNEKLALKHAQKLIAERLEEKDSESSRYGIIAVEKVVIRKKQ